MGKDEYPPIPKIIVGLSVIKINKDFIIEKNYIDIDMKNLNIFFLQEVMKIFLLPLNL